MRVGFVVGYVLFFVDSVCRLGGEKGCINPKIEKNVKKHLFQFFVDSVFRLGVRT